MATPKKLPSGNWRILVFSHFENGKRKYASFTAPTKAEANRLAAEYQANKCNTSEPLSMTLGQAVDKYLESKKNVLSPATYRSYTCIKNQLTSIKNMKIGSITSYDLQEYINDLAKNHKAKTVRNIYGLISSSLGLFTEKNYKVTLPQKNVIERNIPIDADVQNLISNASPKLKLAIVLASVGTLRRGEICALKYKDVSYDFNAIYVHADIVKGVDGWEYKEMPKTDSSVRRVILPKEVIDLIGHGKPDDYIYPFKPGNITDTFKTLRDKLGLQCRFHDLRHYSASILHAIGVPDVYIMERGGWSSDGVLKSIYRNSLADKSTHFTSVANQYFSNALDMQHDMQHGNKKSG